MVRLSATRLSSSNSVQDLEVSQRGCLYPDEQPSGRPSKIYSEYSQPTCIFECALTMAADIEGCTPWYLPTMANSTMCDPWKTARFTKLMETTNSSECTHCLPDCEATTYTTTSTSSPIKRCDSRSLNLNPFCSLDKTIGLTPWLGDVVRQYKKAAGESTVPDYVTNHTSAGQRPWFKYRRDADLEMIIKVIFFCI